MRAVIVAAATLSKGNFRIIIILKPFDLCSQSSACVDSFLSN